MAATGRSQLSSTGAARSPLERVAAVVVNYNSGPWLERCVRTLRSRHSQLPRIVVVDNGSDDGSADPLIGIANLELDRAGTNLGFARGVNRAAARIDSEYLLVINPDCLLVSEALERLVIELDRVPDAAIAAGRVFDTAGNEQRASRRRLPSPGRVLRELLPGTSAGGVDQTHDPVPDGPVDVEAVSGACMLIRRAAFDAVGGFDEAYPMHFEDLDLMARLQRAGWVLRLVPEAIASHAGGISSSRRPVAVLWSKHRGIWRYFSRHCAPDWPVWQRPLWALVLVIHAVLMTPVVWLRRR